MNQERLERALGEAERASAALANAIRELRRELQGLGVRSLPADQRSELTRRLLPALGRVNKELGRAIMLVKGPGYRDRAREALRRRRARARVTGPAVGGRRMEDRVAYEGGEPAEYNGDKPEERGES